MPIELPTTDFPLQGTVAQGYQPLLDAFVRNFKKHNEVGASVAVYHKGELVVDLWGGYADREERQPWQRDSLIVVFSASKGIAAMCLLMLADQGLLDYEKPVAEYWPEFAANGKQDITVHQLLSHTSGLGALDDPYEMAELSDDATWRRLVRSLEQQKPFWVPGSDQGYNAVTFGMYAAELFKRVAGEPMADFYRRELQHTLQADFWIGDADTQSDRIVKLYATGIAERLRRMLPQILFGHSTEAHVGRAFLKPGSLVKKAFTNPAMGPTGPNIYNSPVVQRTPMWWGGGFSNARGLARLYAPFAHAGTLDDVNLVQPSSIEPLYARRTWSERDRVLGKPVGWNRGFLKEEAHIFSPNTESFGHSGMGGALGMADPKAQLSFGYAMNRMDYRIRSPRCIELCHALYDCEAVKG